MENHIKTIILLTLLSLVLVFVGGLVGGRGGMMMAFILSLAMNGAAYFFSDKLALAANGAKEVSREQAPELYSMVDEFTKRAGVPMPKIYMTPEMQANAFATGRDPQHAAVAVTQGLMNTLSREEVKAVIAHEIGHIKNRDILISSIAAVMASTIGYLANMAIFSGVGHGDDDDNGFGIVGALVLSLLAPIGGMLIQMAISRSREFAADQTAKEMIGSGQSLADALRSIHASVAHAPAEHINPAYSSMYIANPLEGLGGKVAHLFSTHPPVEERIQRLLS